MRFRNHNSWRWNMLQWRTWSWGPGLQYIGFKNKPGVSAQCKLSNLGHEGVSSNSITFFETTLLRQRSSQETLSVCGGGASWLTGREKCFGCQVCDIRQPVAAQLLLPLVKASAYVQCYQLSAIFIRSKIPQCKRIHIITTSEVKILQTTIIWLATSVFMAEIASICEATRKKRVVVLRCVSCMCASRMCVISSTIWMVCLSAGDLATRVYFTYSYNFNDCHYSISTLFSSFTLSFFGSGLWNIPTGLLTLQIEQSSILSVDPAVPISSNDFNPPISIHSRSLK